MHFGSKRYREAPKPKELAHFFNLIEEDKLRAFCRQKGTVKGGATDNWGDLITWFRHQHQLHLPRPIFFSDGCALWVLFLGILVFSYSYYL